MVQGLTSFMKLYPSHRKEEIEVCINKAVTFIENSQLSDGSWLFISHSLSLSLWKMIDLQILVGNFNLKV